MPPLRGVSAAIDLFANAGVASILVGGAAAILHGSTYQTFDVDFCCPRDDANLQRIADALNSVHPRFRVEGIAEGVATTLDVRTLRNGMAFSFITDIGYLDVRFDIDGIGAYDAVNALAEDVTIGARTVRMLSLDGLIQTKAFMRRPRDLQLLPELEMMREAVRLRENADQ